MTQLLMPARRVRVFADDRGSPRALETRDGTRLVTRICNRWRVDLDWWRQPVVREYWKVVLDDAVLCEVFQELRTQTWFLERIYD